MKNKLKKLSAARRTKVNKRAKELITQEMTLRDLRKALELTQADMSSKLHMNQEAISRLERRSDLLLSTDTCFLYKGDGRRITSNSQIS